MTVTDWMTEVTDKSNRGMHAGAIDTGLRPVPSALPVDAGPRQTGHSRFKCRSTARRLMAVGVLACAGLLAGCGGGVGKPNAKPTVTKPPAPTAAAPSGSSTTSTTVSQDGPVLAAYRAAWAAYEEALAHANPTDPRLTATLANPLLQRVQANLLGYQHDGIVGRGGVQLHPKVTSLSATTATLSDCMYSNSELVYATTGKPVPPVTPAEHDGVRATLVMVGGSWKVSQQSVTEGRCPPGS
jgi:hypothetical protein